MFFFNKIQDLARKVKSDGGRAVKVIYENMFIGEEGWKDHHITYV